MLELNVAKANSRFKIIRQLKLTAMELSLQILKNTIVMKWEYKIVYIDARHQTASGMPEDVNIKFDEYGREGWELIKVVPKLKGGYYFIIGWINLTVGYTAYFKRALEGN